MRLPLLLLIILSFHAWIAPSMSWAAVELSIEPDGAQPVGEPAVVTLTVTNSGKEPIEWWCGGPELYPAAENFKVEVRESGSDDWYTATASNGQYTQGSGGSQLLKKGQSVKVPLSVPLKGKPAGVLIRITPVKWEAVKPAELDLSLNDNRDALDERRAKMIGAAFPEARPFWQHMSDEYADSVVIDSMMKLVTIDNVPVATGAARVLSKQHDLPETAGSVIAPLIAQWLPRYRQADHDMLGYYLLRAGFKTKSESVRRNVLELLRDSSDASVREVLVDALDEAPGDRAWLQRVRDAVLSVAEERSADPKLVAAAKRVFERAETQLELTLDEK